MHVFCDMTPCQLVRNSKRVDYTDPEEVDNKFLRNVGKYLPFSKKSYSLKT